MSVICILVAYILIVWCILIKTETCAFDFQKNVLLTLHFLQLSYCSFQLLQMSEFNQLDLKLNSYPRLKFLSPPPLLFC